MKQKSIITFLIILMLTVNLAGCKPKPSENDVNSSQSLQGADNEVIILDSSDEQLGSEYSGNDSAVLGEAEKPAVTDTTDKGSQNTGTEQDATDDKANQNNENEDSSASSGNAPTDNSQIDNEGEENGSSSSIDWEDNDVWGPKG